MAHEQRTEVAKQPKDSKSVTEVRRYAEESGTYEVTLVETKRRRITTEDDLVDVIARMAADAHRAWEFERTLKVIGRHDPYLIFAQEFVRNLRIQTNVNDLVKRYLADSTDVTNPPNKPRPIQAKED